MHDGIREQLNGQAENLPDVSGGADDSARNTKKQIT